MNEDVLGWWCSESRQVLMQSLNLFGMNANQLMAMSTGKSFNPNVELLSEGPLFVVSTFSTPSAPKSGEEAQEVATSSSTSRFTIHQ